MTTADIQKHFVTVKNRRVHYLRCGTGPVLVLLHASACSAKVMRDHMVYFGQKFTVIATDTPGFGLSDLLPIETVTTEDLADALVDTLDALGIAQVAVYGRHTGAQIAVEFAARHPHRCAMALSDGFPIYTLQERERRLSTYLPPIVPSFDGSHLLWLWFRYREQHVFWPWNAQDAAHRADTDVPDVHFLHRGVVEMLEAGDGYRIGYATAYRHRGVDACADLKVPVCFAGRPGDSQGHTPQMMPAGSWTHMLPRDKHASMPVELDILLRHVPQGVAPIAPVCSDIPGRTTTQYIDLDGAQVLVRSMGNIHQQAPLVLLHHAPGSSALLDGLLCALGQDHPVLAFDLPGHGESNPMDGEMQDVGHWAQTSVKILAALGVDAFHLYGHNTGAMVAVELAHVVPTRVKSLVLDAPMCLTPDQRTQWTPKWLEGVDPVSPTWDGTHLLRIWHMRRDMGLWWPWFEKNHAHQKTGALHMDPQAVHLEVREMVKQTSSFVPAWRAALAYPMGEALAKTRQACLMMCSDKDLFQPCFEQALTARSDAKAIRLTGDENAKAEAILGFIHAQPTAH